MRDQVLQSSNLMGIWAQAVEGIDSIKYDSAYHQTQFHNAHRYLHNNIYNVEFHSGAMGRSMQTRVRRPYVGIVRGPGMVEDYADFTRY